MYVNIAAIHSQLAQVAQVRAGSQAADAQAKSFHPQPAPAPANSPAKSPRSTAEQWTMCCEDFRERGPLYYQNALDQH